jgi:hypothetical protein
VAERAALLRLAGLDERGNWYMRDDRTQAAGPFPQAKGSLLRHEKLVDFIHRNYDHDDAGPVVLPERAAARVRGTAGHALDLAHRQADGASTSHTGPAGAGARLPGRRKGRLYLDTDLGFGLVHTLDMVQAADAVEKGAGRREEVQAATCPIASASCAARRRRSRTHEKAGATGFFWKERAYLAAPTM